jgi:CheY-like chemotaxis protein
MSGSELITLQLLIVFRTDADRELLRRGAGLASVPAEVVEADNAAAAKSLLASGGIDIVLVEAALPAADKAVVSQAARKAPGSPFVVIVGTDTDSTDADGFIARPRTVLQAQSVIDRSIRVRIPRRVLVVDDSAPMRGIVRKILSASKFPLEIAEAGEGVQALEELRGGAFDIVFLDCNMPGLDGFGTLAELKQTHRDVMVVMMTSVDDKTFADRAREAGAAAFLTKPFFPSDIDAVLYRFYQMEGPARRTGSGG